MRNAAAVSRVAAAALAGLGVVFAASGWLYFVDAGRNRLGPGLRDALPLDELPRHSTVPLVVFLAVWIGAGALLGLVARLADAVRAAAGVHAVYIPAALAGLAGALLGSTRRGVHPRAPLVLAAFVAVAGFIAVLDALLPDYRRTLVG